MSLCIRTDLLTFHDDFVYSVLDDAELTFFSGFFSRASVDEYVSREKKYRNSAKGAWTLYDFGLKLFVWSMIFSAMNTAWHRSLRIEETLLLRRPIRGFYAL